MCGLFSAGQWPLVNLLALHKTQRYHTHRAPESWVLGCKIIAPRGFLGGQFWGEAL